MKKRNDRIGEESVNRQGVRMRIVNYENNKRVLVEFPDTGEHKWARYDKFRLGRVKAEISEQPGVECNGQRTGCLITIAAIVVWLALILLLVKWLW